MARMWIFDQEPGAGASADQAQILQWVRDAIAADPTIALRTIETVTDLPGINRQVAIVDNDMKPNENGLYGFVDLRTWRKLSEI